MPPYASVSSRSDPPAPSTSAAAFTLNVGESEWDAASWKRYGARLPSGTAAPAAGAGTSEPTRHAMTLEPLRCV